MWHDFCFCFNFSRSHARYGCCSIVCVSSQVVQIKQHGDQINSKIKIQDIPGPSGRFSNFSRTTEQEIQGHFQGIWLKSDNIKEIPGPKLIIKKADILTQGPYKVLSHIFPDFVPNSYDFS